MDYKKAFNEILSGNIGLRQATRQVPLLHRLELSYRDDIPRREPRLEVG